MDHYYKPADDELEDAVLDRVRNLKILYRQSVFYKNKERQEAFKIMLKNFYLCDKFRDLNNDQYLKLKRFLIKNVDTGRLF